MTSSNRRDHAGQWLREQRERRGITSQAELARLLGWDKSAVNNYETRGVAVPDERAAQLAEFFGLDIITVRRNLGLWVPPEDAGDSQPKDGGDDDSRMQEAMKLMAEAHELLAEIRRGRRKGA